jgi:predicted nucleic acid-binding Zn finger protein
MIESLPEECRGLAISMPDNSLKKAVSSALSRRIHLIHKEPEIYFFLGEERDHILLREKFCNCMDFLLNVVIRKKRVSCYHLLALCISLEKGYIVERVVEDKVLLMRVIREVIIDGKSRLMRKILSEARL